MITPAEIVCDGADGFEPIIALNVKRVAALRRLILFAMDNEIVRGNLHECGYCHERQYLADGESLNRHLGDCIYWDAHDLQINLGLFTEAEFSRKDKQ